MVCWTEQHSLETWRAYNYPHVTLVYWSLYRLGRWNTPALTTRQDWRCENSLLDGFNFPPNGFPILHV